MCEGRGVYNGAALMDHSSDLWTLPEWSVDGWSSFSSSSLFSYLSIRFTLNSAGPSHYVFFLQKHNIFCLLLFLSYSKLYTCIHIIYWKLQNIEYE